MNKLTLFLMATLIVHLSVPAQGALKQRPSLVRITFEEIDLPAGETMGLLGTNYLLHLNKNIYAGLGIYSAVSGKRGGFFTGGLEAGFKTKLGHTWELDTGIFIGGGGGGAAPQGGGLMIRPHIGLLYKTDMGNIGLQFSQVDFPDGDIKSNQLSLSYEKDFRTLFSPHWLNEKRVSSYDHYTIRKNKPATQDLTVIIQNYDLPVNTLNTEGVIQDKNMSLVGIEWDYYLNDNSFFRLQPLGALGGDSDGYASLLMGLGYRYNITQNTSFKIAGTLGASGGGRLATGGGFTADAAMNLQHRFANGLLVGLRAGVVGAPDGDFEATSLGLQIGYSDMPPTGRKFTSDDIKTRHWRLRGTHQTYRPRGDTRRKDSNVEDSRDVHLFGLQTDLFINNNIYLSGQAIGAYDGGAGGYAAGLVGVGYMTPLWKNSRLLLNTELLVGAAGGGGLAVGDGLVTQGMIGLGYRTSRASSLHASFGRIQSHNGHFEADVINLTFGLRFSTLAWK